MVHKRSVTDLDKNKGVWLDLDGVNWLVNTGRQSLNSKCHYEYQEMLVCVCVCVWPPYSPTWNRHWCFIYYNNP